MPSPQIVTVHPGHAVFADVDDADEVVVQRHPTQRGGIVRLNGLGQVEEIRRLQKLPDVLRGEFASNVPVHFRVIEPGLLDGSLDLADVFPVEQKVLRQTENPGQSDDVLRPDVNEIDDEAIALRWVSAQTPPNLLGESHG